MDSQKVEMYMMNYSKYVEGDKLMILKEMLQRADDSKFMRLQAISLKDPTMMLIVSLLAGGLGIDRFMLGDTGMGIGKLLTCGGLGIWAIVDLFLIMGRAKERNFEMIAGALA
ncbi:MAG: TM2 domain-containing protein [Sphingobacteriales bacterium]|nr:MAG: TM2 domain-containing protein [Sphingobacteriales bacterium]